MTSLTPDHVARKHVSFRPKNTDAPPLRKHLFLRSLGENISSQRVGKSGKKRWRDKMDAAGRQQPTGKRSAPVCTSDRTHFVSFPQDHIHPTHIRRAISYKLGCLKKEEKATSAS